MKENVAVASAATTSTELPPRGAEALGELVGAAKEGLSRSASASGSA